MRCGAINDNVIKHFTETLAYLFQNFKFDPEFIWNMDESGFSFDQNSLYTYCRRGRKNVHAKSSGNREHVSIVSSVSAAGQSMPPFFLFKCDGKDLLHGAPLGSDYYNTKKAYMTDEAWPYFVRHFVEALPDRPADQHVLFVLEGYGSHDADVYLLEYLDGQKIILFALPAHQVRCYNHLT
eukprot:Pompholyxophrys_sp_v1_NODE_57_length_2826_cov_4.619271.p1 type:complete len:181 gc:universal NODE_57_length_2826_cov_4.619271:1826-1284(-)